MNYVEDRRRLEAEIYIVPNVVPIGELNWFKLPNVFFCWNFMNTAYNRHDCKEVHCDSWQYHVYLKHPNVIGEGRFLGYARDI